jgi:hypothetical protein
MKKIEAGFVDLIVESDSSDEERAKKPAALPRAEDMIAPIKDTCKALTARGVGARNLVTKLSKNSLTELAGHLPG